MKSKLTVFIVGALVLGVGLGLAAHYLLDEESRAAVVGVLDTVTHLFLNLIKMVIAPLIFGTIVTGITGMNKAKGLGGLFVKALAWFITASVLIGLYGFGMAHLLGVGNGLDLVATDGGSGLSTDTLDPAKFIEELAPQSFIQALASNKPIQILVFALFFGVALLALKSSGHTRLSVIIDELTAAMFKVTGYVMMLAPIGVFAAVAGAFVSQGFDAFTTYGSLIAGFYASLAGLWVILVFVGVLFLGRAAFRLIKAVREPMVIAFSTASTEAAFPKLVESLTRFGVDRRTTGLVLPLGYAFNIDGSMMYMTFASAFLVNAYNLDLSVAQQLMMCAVLLISSKGMAGVPRGALVVMAAVVPAFGVPASGIALLLVIDQILDMGRTATNILGNAIAVAVLGRGHNHPADAVEELLDEATADDVPSAALIASPDNAGQPADPGTAKAALTH